MPPHGKKRANYLHGSHPVQVGRDKVVRLGTPAIRQHTGTRHYALASIGPTALAAELNGRREFFNGPHFVDATAFDWMLRNLLIELRPAERPGGAQQVVRTERGDEVLAAWNEKYGEIDIEEGF